MVKTRARRYGSESALPAAPATPVPTPPAQPTAGQSSPREATATRALSGAHSTSRAPPSSVTQQTHSHSGITIITLKAEHARRLANFAAQEQALLAREQALLAQERQALATRIAQESLAADFELQRALSEARGSARSCGFEDHTRHSACSFDSRRSDPLQPATTLCPFTLYPQMPPHLTDGSPRQMVPPATTAEDLIPPGPPAAVPASRAIGLDAEVLRPVLRTEQAAPEAALPNNIHCRHTDSHIGTHTRRCDNVNTNTLVEQGTQLAFNTLAAAIRDLKDVGPRRKVSDLELPLFDGRSTDRLAFRRAFDYTYASYTHIENLARLSRAIRGAAREAVGTLLLTAEEPLEVLRALEARFARPELIVLEQIALLRTLPRLQSSENANDLSKFACRVRTAVDTIRLLNQPEYLASPEVANSILGKLTPLLRSRWADFAAAHMHTKTKLELLSEFLFREADLHVTFGLLDSFEHVKPKISVHVAAVTKKVHNHKPRQSQDDTQSSCRFCATDGHGVATCSQFKSLTTDDRWRWILQEKVCHKCFRRGHRYITCRKAVCDVPNCELRNRHHTLLHKEVAVNTVTVVDESNSNESQNGSSSIDQKCVTVAHSSDNDGMRALLKIIPVYISGPAGSVDTFALLDDGATTSFIDAEVAAAIGATGPQSTLEVNCIGGLTKAISASFVDVSLRGHHSDQTHTVKGVRTIPSLGLTEQTVDYASIQSCQHLQGIAQQLCYTSGKPTIIIGADNWHLTIPLEIRKGSKAQPVATLTALGWVLYGFTSSKTSPVLHLVNHVSLSEPEQISLEALVKNNYSLDAIGVTKIIRPSEIDQQAVDVLTKTTKRLANGRFETGLLWRKGVDPKLVPDSYNLALSRFKCLERKFLTSEPYAEAYRQNIKATIDKGYAEPCPETVPPERVVWYLPHFGVVHPQKKKLRVVQDCAALCKGVSLNSMLLTGPDLLQPLLAILMRFREGAFGLNADIREMYPQIKIRPEDRDAQRFLWRESPAQPVKTFRMSSMIFGAASSPFTAIFLKNKNADDFKAVLPEAAKVIVNDHYMDDLLTSVNSVGDGAQLAADVVHVHSHAGFEMRAWASNSPSVLAQVPAELWAISVSPDGLISPPAIRTLGVWWELNSDALQLVRSSINTENFPSSPSKRNVLANLMAVYDPLGLLSPLVVKGKIIFQRTWKVNVGWDDKLPSNLVDAWLAWRAELARLANISISRCYGPLDSRINTQLHIFADASELAYACVAYWRFEYSDGSVKLALVGGNTRLVPLKPVTIPRLELQAALIAARFSLYITEAHSNKPNAVCLWSDSVTVLHWLRSDARVFKPFVAHRVCEITDITNARDWRYVPTRLNVADDATRPDTIFGPSCRWFQGPSFLTLPPEKWPREPSAHPNLAPEERKRIREQACPVLIRQSLLLPPVPDVTHFSAWTRLLHATARFYKAIQIFRYFVNKNFQYSRYIDASDLAAAERKLFLAVQIQSFGEEYKCLQSKLQLPKHSRLRWSLKLDDEGLIRLAGRTNAFSPSGSFSPNPIVLDGRHPIVHLFIKHLHVRAAHANCETVVNEARQNLFILGLRPAVKSIRNSCSMCKLRRTMPATPPTGDLPPERLAAGLRPFSNVGLDYFGPVSVAVGRRSEKRYVALFTCLTVRAVHLEIVSSLTSDSAIMAIRRFVARRGCPTTLWSDNGTAFIGADRILSAAADLRIKWRFIPPVFPFMGGCWERLVRSVKVALAATLHERSPKEEVLGTLLCEAEALINSRPLTHVSVDPSDPEAVTPNHFLLGTSSPYWPLACVEDSDLVRRVCWRKGLRLADHFWTRWVREYLPQLTPRPRGGAEVRVKEGDVVLIADASLPRGTWPRGRVLKAHPGKDGIVRVVDVETLGGTLRRPLRKLVVL